MDYDVVINGGGLVGASLACALKNQPLKIAIIDPMPFTKDEKSHFDARAIALSDISIHCLKSLKIWEALHLEAEPILEVHVSKQGHFGVTRLKAEEEQHSNFGYVVNANKVNEALTNALTNAPNIDILCPDKIMGFTRENQIWNLSLDSKKTLRTALLVGAEGTDSFVRKSQGVETRMIEYAHHAIVVNVGLVQDHQGIAFERFTKEGTLAMLPFGQHKVKCVWIVPKTDSTVLMEISESKFLEKCQATFGHRLGRLEKLGKRIHYPLRQVVSETLYGDGFVLVGNAANTLNPVAAQGFNLGLRDIAELAERLVNAKQKGEEIGSITFLKEYANARVLDHQITQRLTHFLAEPKLTHWLGILACEGLPFVKPWIIQKGRGMNHSLPKLCRGIRL